MKNSEELENELNNKINSSIYLLYGEETYLLESCLKKIKKNFGEIITGINYIKIDDTNVNLIVSEMETPAFGFEKKLIIARDTGLFKQDIGKKVQNNSEIVERICNYINKNLNFIKDEFVVVFIEKEVNKNKLYKLFDKVGTVCEFSVMKQPEVVKKIRNICKLYKVNIDDATARYLTECIGLNMQDVINELRKQIEYAGQNGVITKESIDKLCEKKIESVIFDLTDNLGKRNTKEALKILNNLIYNREPIQKILVTLYNHFKKLYLLKLSVKNNESIQENLKLNPQYPFLVSKYKMQANYFKEDELRKIMEELIDLDYNYKMGLIDLNIGIESILCRYCS